MFRAEMYSNLDQLVCSPVHSPLIFYLLLWFFVNYCPITFVISQLNSMGCCTCLQKHCHPTSLSPGNFFWAPLLIVSVGFLNKKHQFFITSVKCISEHICLLSISQGTDAVQFCLALTSSTLHKCISELSQFHGSHRVWFGKYATCEENVSLMGGD